MKTDVVHDNGVVGEVYQATAEDMESFYNNADESLATKKYVYLRKREKITKTAILGKKCPSTYFFLPTGVYEPSKNKLYCSRPYLEIFRYYESKSA